MDKNERAVKELANGIKGYVDKITNALPFDKTVEGKVTNITTSVYSILINKVTYKCSRKLSNITVTVGEIVIVRVPQGNWNKIFIEGKIG